MSNIKAAVLNEFDIVTHIAVGDGTNPESPADTTLGNEVRREPLMDKVKDTLNGKYIFSMQLGLTEANGTTLSEIGIFDSASGGNMQARKLLPNTLLKTADKEVWIDLEVGVTVTSL